MIKALCDNAISNIILVREKRKAVLLKIRNETELSIILIPSQWSIWSADQSNKAREAIKIERKIVSISK